MTLEFKINRPGFPVKIGEVELWFDDSPENLTKFLDMRKEASKKAMEMGEKLKPYENLDEDTMDSETAKKIIELKKEYVSYFYDMAFGEGCFNKLYEKHPYINELEMLITTLDKSISDKIIERESEREKLVDGVKEKALNKQKAKTK